MDENLIVIYFVQIVLSNQVLSKETLLPCGGVL